MYSSSEITIFGNVTNIKYPSTTYPNFVTFSIAVRKKNKDGNNETTWFQCQTSNEKLTFEVIKKYVKENTAVYVRGVPKLEAYLDREGKPQGTIKVNIWELKILSSNKTEEKETTTYDSLDDDIPF